MTSLEKRLDAKSDLMMRKLDEILNGSSREERFNPRERSRQANDGDGAGNYAGDQQNSRANYESRNRERPIEARLDEPGPAGDGYPPPPRRQDCPLCHKSDWSQI